MNNLIQNYKIILKELKETCKNIPTKKQIRKPKLSDMELVALNITAEYMSINSELQLFRCIAGTELDSKIERSVYNKRKRKLFSYIEKIRKTLSEKFSDFTDVFIVDSTPIEICKVSRAHRSAICSTDEIHPSFGYCAAKKSKYFGYKLHAVCDKNDIFHSFDFTPANVHDINYLKDIKEDFKNCELIGDRGYISKEIQLDLFNCSNINLSVPMRKNQHDFVAFPKVKSRIRKRIETNFSQLCGQFLMGINLAKTFQGFITRILSKITSFTMIQYLNFFVFKRDLNKIKVNLC
ncbi:IS982 family transposase [Riemerella columbina]|uniref:IS982 family transposase n=1 Tax=Riemerella columbina TaxID=103810 RepID=UPI00267080FF|nr:IS982 family transposase [Riemerella columbina]WKS94553.1 IS982 family transposase [Riemerella columbina]